MKKTNSILFSLFISLSITIGLLSTLSTTSASSQSIKKSDKFSHHSLSATTPLTASEPFELLGQVGGLINHVAVSGTYAYVNTDRHLAVLDVTNPKSISLVDTTNLLSADITDIDIYNQHLFVSTSDGFYAFGLADPRHPQLLGSYSINGYERKTEFFDKYAYSVANDYLSIFDISDPTSLKLQTFRMIGSGYFEDSSPKLTIAENILYNVYCWSHANAAENQAAAPNEENGFGYCAIDIYSLTDPANPGQIGTVGVSLNYDHHFILADGNQLFSTDTRLGIFDVANPANAVQKSLVDVGTQGFTSSPGITFMAKQDQYLYLAGEQYVDEAKSRSNAWFQVVDVTNPTSPTLYSAITMPYLIRDMAIAENRLYLADGSLQILDISNPAAPTTMGSYSVYGDDIANSQFMIASDDHVYLAGKKLLTVDASTPTDLAVASVYTTAGNATSLAISDTRAYLHLTNQAGDQWLRILDLNQPTAPTQLGYLLPSAANDSEVVGNLLYTVDAQGFNVIDVSQPLTPTLVDTIHTGHPATALEIIGNYAYVVLADGYVVTIDLAQRQVVAGQQFNAADIRHAGNKLIMRTNPASIDVFEVNPAIQPTATHRYCIWGLSELAVSDNYLFAWAPNAIEVYSLAAPNTPSPVVRYEMDNIEKLIATNTKLFVIRNGLVQLFDWHPPTTTFLPPQLVSFGHVTTPMIYDSTFLNIWIEPNPTYPLTITWEVEGTADKSIVLDSPEDPCLRYVFLTLEDDLSWSSPGFKTITVTVENVAGTLHATPTIFIDNYVPITVTATSGATLLDCNRLSVTNENCESAPYPLLVVPAATVTKPTQLQYTHYFSLPHRFDKTKLDEPEAAYVKALPYNEVHFYTELAPHPFRLEATQDQQVLSEFHFSHPFTITRHFYDDTDFSIDSRFNIDRIHLRRWDGEKWVREPNPASVQAGLGRSYFISVVIQQTGEYAFFAELRHTTDWSYLPLITRN